MEIFSRIFYMILKVLGKQHFLKVNGLPHRLHARMYIGAFDGTLANSQGNISSNWTFTSSPIRNDPHLVIHNLWLALAP